MAEYIEREALLEEINEKISNIAFNSPYQDEVGIMASGMARIRDSVEDAPAADVVPVVHGGWIAVKDFGGGHCVGFCDKCRTIHTSSSPTALKLEYRFCRWCGARMDGE